MINTFVLVFVVICIFFLCSNEIILYNKKHFYSTDPMEEQIYSEIRSETGNPPIQIL